jgi:hypothetical protein
MPSSSTNPAQPSAVLGGDITSNAHAEAVIAILNAQCYRHIDAIKLLQPNADANLTDREKRAALAAMQAEAEDCFIGMRAIITLKKPGPERDEFLRRLAADPDALKEGPELLRRVGHELRNAERATRAEVGQSGAHSPL